MYNLFAALLVLIVSNTTFAAECPVVDLNENYMDNVAAQINAAKGCYAAAEIAESCAMGSSMDRMIAGTATTVCEVDFTKKLGVADKKAYGSLLQKCTKKYENMSGTMYVSAAAFCYLNVSRLFSQLYTPAE